MEIIGRGRKERKGLEVANKGRKSYKCDREEELTFKLLSNIL